MSRAYESLKKHLKLDHETKIRSYRAQTVIPDDSVLEHFNIDTRSLILGEFTGQNEREVEENSFVDAWGVTWKKAPDGHFINVNGPFQKNEPCIDVLETYPWPNPDDPNLYQGLKVRSEFLRKSTQCAVVLSLPLGVVHQSQFLRGFAEWLLDLADEPDFAARMMDFISDIWIRIAVNALEIVGSNVDVIEWGDDVAMQESLLFSPEMYRKQIKPYHRKMIQAIKSKTKARVLFHSCGAVSPIIGDLIEIGVDALNPVQVSAKNMDPNVLKKKYGNQIAFWGGIDTQYILPKESPIRVREEVQRIVRLLGKSGGYILASVHNIQSDVPPENIVAMLEEAKIARW